ncbi:MAG: ABC transporter ATP-binding protein, partial [Thermoprotei archaeon]
LISDPDIILLDELPLKPSSWRMLRSLQRRMGFTVVWTTHDLREALAVADKILTIRGHSIEVLKTEELN